MVIHESAEDYLESILVLQQRRGQGRSIDIVNELGYSKPSVSIAMKKLRENGYISMDADGFITLNESGLEVASRVYGRHKTLSKLFVLLGVTPEVASEDACKVEHDLSEETFRCIQQYLEKMTATKFDILDEVRHLETGADFPASLSIGVGAGGKDLAQTEAYADAALDLALGRGGDQAVVKRNKVEYFGGKLQTVEKSNKGKSRIVGHALKQLIDQSKKIFIMGHANPDMDSFGSALGITRLCVLCEKEPYLVIDEVNESLQEIFRQAKESDNYQFISSEKAVSLADEESLLIVTDTHRPSLVQCPELLKICERIVVVDHHRKMEECIENPVLAYMESYASSASELVAEMLQYMISKKSLNKLEAEALLAGMTIDTNGFSVKTGVRTFEAAAWLRRQGADPTEVKRFFQEEISNIKLRAEAVLSAQVYENGVAISACRKERSDAQILCAQVADQLLTVKGVKASFVAGRNDAGKTVISARSLGEVNVQVIMEKFGGGGHLTTAAAQVDSGIGETIKKIMDMMEVEQDDSNLK